MRKLLLIIAFFAPEALWGQGPNCQFATTFTSATRLPATLGIPAQSTATGAPCVSWRVTYQASNMSAVSLSFQGSPDNGSGAPTGVWTTLGAACPASNPCSIVTGANPMTDTAESNLQVTGYYPWLSLNMGTFTGTGSVLVKVFGYQGSSPAPSSGGGGVVPSNVNIAQVAGVTTANDGNGAQVPPGSAAAFADGASNTPDRPLYEVATVNGPGVQSAYEMRFNGATWDRDYGCTKQAVINLSGSGNTQIIAASGSTTVRICHISMSTTAAEDIKLTEGTGLNCGTGTADLTGLYKSVLALALDFGFASSARAQTAGDAICINQSAGQANGGIVIYAQY